MTPKEARSIYYDKIIDIAKKHNIDPWRLVRIQYRGIRQYFTDHPDFTEVLSKVSEIQFSYLVLDGIPIFKGDVIYDRNGTKLIYDSQSNSNPLEHIFQTSCNSGRFYFFESDLFLYDPMNDEITLKLKRNDINRILELLNLFNESVKIDDIEEKLKGTLNAKNSTI